MRISTCNQAQVRAAARGRSRGDVVETEGDYPNGRYYSERNEDQTMLLNRAELCLVLRDMELKHYEV